MKTLRTIVPVAIVVLCCSMKAFAGPPASPEINPGDGIAAIALLAGAATIFRSRLKR